MMAERAHVPTPPILAANQREATPPSYSAVRHRATASATRPTPRAFTQHTHHLYHPDARAVFG